MSHRIVGDERAVLPQGLHSIVYEGETYYLDEAVKVKTFLQPRLLDSRPVLEVTTDLATRITTSTHLVSISSE